MTKKANITKKTKKAQVKTVTMSKPKKTAPTKVCGKGKQAQAMKGTKPTKKTAQPKVAQPRKPKIAQAPRRSVRIAGDTYHAKGKKLYEIPAESTLKRLKKQGVTRMRWGNGDELIIK